MLTRYRIPLTALLVLTIGAGMGVSSPSAPMTVVDPPECLTVDQTLSPGVTAKGFVMLSAPLRSDDGARRVRVAALWITLTAGADDKTEIKGTPSVETGSSAACSSGVQQSVQKLPDGSRRIVSVGFELRTRGDKTWADVHDSGDLEAVVTRNVEVR